MENQKVDIFDRQMTAISRVSLTADEQNSEHIYTTTIGEFLNPKQQYKFYEPIKAIRELCPNLEEKLKNKPSVDALKKRLPAGIISGVAEGGIGEQNLVELNNVAQVDIDGQDNPDIYDWQAVKDMLSKSLGIKSKEVETSLIESFIYPKLGPGQLWETAAKDIQGKGGRIEMNSSVNKVHVEGNHVDYIETIKSDGKTERTACDYFLSSMPIKDLVKAIDGIEIPKDVQRIANELPYRDFITVGLLVKKLKMNNQTKIKTYKNRIPDTWIYIQERDVKIGRLQIFNNWSPYLVNDYENTVWIGLEYFCTEGDELWSIDKDKFIEMAINELVHIGFIDKEDVIDSTQVKIKKAYPAYYGSYYQLDKVKKFLDSIDNLYCIGRNGQHRYNNMDHSMMTAMETVDQIKAGNINKTAIWSINTEEEYHEKK